MQLVSHNCACSCWTHWLWHCVQQLVRGTCFPPVWGKVSIKMNADSCTELQLWKAAFLSPVIVLSYLKILRKPKCDSQKKWKGSIKKAVSICATCGEETMTPLVERRELRGLENSHCLMYLFVVERKSWLCWRFHLSLLFMPWLCARWIASRQPQSGKKPVLLLSAVSEWYENT